MTCIMPLRRLRVVRDLCWNYIDLIPSKQHFGLKCKGAMSAFASLVRVGFAISHSSVQQCTRQFSTSLCGRIRMHAIPQPKVVDRWTEKRSMFGVYDNIGILGDFKVHPKDIVKAPIWLKGFRGNELERLIRKKKMVGDRMMTDDRHNLEKRIRYLYRRFNRYGKHR